MWGGRHCREDEGCLVKMVWIRNKKEMRTAGQRHYGMKYQKMWVVDIAEKVREARR